jgi:hypothetical protein
MKELLDRNYIQGQKRLKAQKRQEKFESFLTTMIGLFIIGATIFILSVQGQQAIEKCMEAGHTQAFCEKGLQ